MKHGTPSQANRGPKNPSRSRPVGVQSLSAHPLGVPTSSNNLSRGLVWLI
jgi:hypothetical protein